MNLSFYSDGTKDTCISKMMSTCISNLVAIDLGS